jgi:hypothetical protein
MSAGYQLRVPTVKLDHVRKSKLAIQVLTLHVQLLAIYITYSIISSFNIMTSDQVLHTIGNFF